MHTKLMNFIQFKQILFKHKSTILKGITFQGKEWKGREEMKGKNLNTKGMLSRDLKTA